ncbi:GumC family protein [Thiocapsa rosea]|nr:Wzz/FepE/Etk N-terminal domain-containing protein [Thiocapsa rosea]
MSDQALSLDDYIAIINRRKWQFILPAFLVMLAAATIAMTLPAVYRSTATILIEQQEIPADLVRSTVTSYAGERIQVISQRVMTTENLGRIIEAYDLYPDLRRDLDLGAAVARMRSDIVREMINAQFADPRSGRPTSATIAFSVSFDSPSPLLAQQVAQEIASLYLEKNLRERTRTAQESTSFLEQESRKLADEVAEIEERLALFKEEHGDRLPELMKLNLDLMQRTEDRLRSTAHEMTSLDEQAIYLASELALMDPYSAVYSSSGQRVMKPADRLKALEAEYVGIASKYSAAHPDRIKIEREMASLRGIVGSTDSRDLRRRLNEQQSELSSLLDRYSPGHPDVSRLEREIGLTRQRLSSYGAGSGDTRVPDADNPAYIQLQARLSATESKLASLRRVQSELESNLRDYEQRILQSPQIERAYSSLVRDHEQAVNSYKDINAKLNAARLAETLETESRGERFSLIDPASLPGQPYSPDRIAIFFFGFVLAIGSGVGNIAFREATDQRLYGPRSVQAITGSSPLALIPLIITHEDRAARSKKIRAIVASAIVAVVMSLLIVHVFVVPLNSLWLNSSGDTEARESSGTG